MAETLIERVRARGPRPWPEVIRIVRGVSSAVGQAHLRKRGHGAISARTITCFRGEGARAIRVVLPPARVSVVPDLAWDAVENVLGPRHPSPAADVWALGLVAYFVIAGRMLWRSADEHGVVVDPVRLVAELRTPPRASERLAEQRVTPPIPGTFDDWLATCLAAHPGDRFASAPKAVAALVCLRPKSLARAAPSAPRAVGFPSRQG